MAARAIARAAALEYLLALRIERIVRHDQELVEQLVCALGELGYRFVSPTDPSERAAIVVISSGDPKRNCELYHRLSAAGVDVALRACGRVSEQFSERGCGCGREPPGVLGGRDHPRQVLAYELGVTRDKGMTSG